MKVNQRLVISHIVKTSRNFTLNKLYKEKVSKTRLYGDRKTVKERESGTFKF